MKITKLMVCKQPTCGCKVRHYWDDELVDDELVYGWRCGNCSRWTRAKDRRRKAETGSTVFDRVIAKLEAEEDFLGRKRWSGYCTFEELEEMSKHHALREWATHSDFGIVPVPKRTLSYFFTDGYQQRSAARLAEKTGRPVEASVHIERKDNRSGATYRVVVRGMYAFTDDERSSYFPL